MIQYVLLTPVLIYLLHKLGYLPNGVSAGLNAAGATALSMADDYNNQYIDEEDRPVKGE